MKTHSSPYCKLRSVDLRAVRWTTGFWAERFRQCREVTLPHLWDLLADPNRGHALTNLRIAAGLEKGEFVGTHWQDEWVYKWIEAAASSYAHTGDAALDRRMDEVADIIARAQQPDGYIATQITVRGWPRFKNINHHELYVMGHLITAACIHHRVTGKTALLDVARKAADYIWETFKGRDPALAHFPFNPTIIMAGVELYRTTGERRYLDMSNLFIEMRGSQPGGSDQNQDFVPLRKETEVVGHAVLSGYLYAGAADAYLETGDGTLLEALDRLWRDLTERKLYVTGGTCAVHRGLSIRWMGDGRWARAAFDVHEAAGPPYDLPNATAYNETCAQIANAMWNWRMLAIRGEARYADFIEETTYNSILSGIGLDGASWFYTNPLRWHGREHALLSQDAHERFQPGRIHICCPSNLLRFVAEMHGCAYSVSEEGLWANLYGANEFSGHLADGTALGLVQKTEYPWEGEVVIEVARGAGRSFGIMLRIPGWAEGARVRVNGKAAPVRAQAGTYARIERTWSAGDQIALSLPMKPRLVEAHPRVEHARNQAAIMRGPIAYCLESPDLPEGVEVPEVYLPRRARLSARFVPDLLGGVTVLEGEAGRIPQGDWSGRLYRPLGKTRLEKVKVRFVPYYAWANRGVSRMTVWLPLC